MKLSTAFVNSMICLAFLYSLPLHASQSSEAQKEATIMSEEKINSLPEEKQTVGDSENENLKSEISKNSNHTPSSWGVSAGLGVPFLTQLGASYINSSSLWSAELLYHSFSLTIASVTLKASKPEGIVRWHPFRGAFFLGLGLGQQTLSAEAFDLGASSNIKVSLTSFASTPYLGWMWGLANRGFYTCIEFGAQISSDSKTSITTSLTSNNQTYIDTVEQSNKYGNLTLPVMTLLRIGYLF